MTLIAMEVVSEVSWVVPARGENVMTLDSNRDHIWHFIGSIPSFQKHHVILSYVKQKHINPLYHSMLHIWPISYPFIDLGCFMSLPFSCMNIVRLWLDIKSWDRLTDTLHLPKYFRHILPVGDILFIIDCELACSTWCFGNAKIHKLN